MLKIIISGCNGGMGKVLTSLISQEDDMEIVAGFDINDVQLGSYPVFSDFSVYSGEADVIIDFSSPAALAPLLSYAERTRLPMVLAVTGYSQEQLDMIADAGKRLRIFKTANMSIGINLLCDLVSRAASILGDSFDIEIVERHHNRKVDAPSGTALMLADAASSSRSDVDKYVYDRHSVRHRREKGEIGISSIRGGNIAGDHQVIFAGQNEVIELNHHAASREVFASGALRAARYICGVSEPGIYDMRNLIASL